MPEYFSPVSFLLCTGMKTSKRRKTLYDKVKGNAPSFRPRYLLQLCRRPQPQNAHINRHSILMFHAATIGQTIGEKQLVNRSVKNGCNRFCE